MFYIPIWLHIASRLAYTEDLVFRPLEDISSYPDQFSSVSMQDPKYLGVHGGSDATQNTTSLVTRPLSPTPNPFRGQLIHLHSRKALPRVG